jgi:hypothetical protein
MAIPVMKGSIVPQLNQVEVAEGRAVDASKQISSMFNDVSQFLSNRAEFEQRQKDRDDMMLAMKAENDYTNKIALLNKELSQFSGEELEAHKEAYKQRAWFLHDKYLQKISGIRDSYIKEKSRAKINTFNTENKVRSEMIFYKNQKDMFMDSYRRNMKEDNENAASYITGNLDYDVATLKNVVDDKIKNISEIGVKDGWTKEETRDEIQAQIGEFINISAEKLATSQDFEKGGFEAYRPVLEYVRKSFEEGYLTHEQYAAISRPHEKHAVELETRMMAAEAYKKKKIRGYVSVLAKNGDVNKAFLERVKEFTPNLRPEERYKFIKDMAGIAFANPALSKEGQAQVQAYNDELYRKYVIEGLDYLEDGVYRSVFDKSSQNRFDVNEEETLALIKEGKITRGQVFAWFNSYQRELMQGATLPNGEYVKTVGTQDTQRQLLDAFSRINRLFAGALQGEDNFVPRGHTATLSDVLVGVAVNSLEGKYKEPRMFLGIKWGTKQNQVQGVGRIMDYTHNLWEKYSDKELNAAWSSMSIEKQKEAIGFIATNMVMADLAENPEYNKMLADDREKDAKEKIRLISNALYSKLQNMGQVPSEKQTRPVRNTKTVNTPFGALPVRTTGTGVRFVDFSQMGNN